MNSLLTKSALAAAIALTISACSPGDGGSVAGIGGSGYISSGSVTGFGSVFVNGVEFETDSSIFDVDGVSGTQDDLAIGMIVKVDGSINVDGITGIATSISFDDELQGPVKGPITYDADMLTATFTVLGVKVIVDSSSTTFDLDGDLPVNTKFEFDIAVADNVFSENNNVEISGFFDTNGDLHATRLELKDITFDINSIVEVKGTISDTSGTSFNLAGLMVDASSAALDDLPNGLEDGVLVEVKGTLSADLETIIATKVEAEDNSPGDSDEFEIEGIITNYNSTNNTFNIGDIFVDASSPTLDLEPATLILENDVHVEVEGAIIGGILIATEVEAEDGDIKVHAEVSDVDPIAGTFDVTPVPGSGQAITVTISSDTQLEDDVGDIEPFTLNNLKIGDFVEVRGFEDEAGGISAMEVDVKDVSDVLLQGFATAKISSTASGGTITILGVDIDFDSATVFENKNDAILEPAELDALIADILTTPQLLKIEDNKSGTGVNPVGTADEIDIE